MRSDNSIQEFLAFLSSSSRSGYVSGQVLADGASVSRSAIWKLIRKLRRYGYEIDSLRGSGYRLTRVTEFPVPWELKKMIHASFIGRDIVYREVVDSTQDIALSIAAGHPGSHGTVVIAGQQKAGRGRMKRRWLSPRGGLWFSVILEPEISTGRITLLPLVAALAVRDAIQMCTLVEVKLKWPNDIMIAGSKVAGILLEISAEADRVNHAVIGIGINANFESSSILTALKDESAQRVTSLRSELGHNVSRLELTRDILEKLEKYYLLLVNEGSSSLIEAWKNHSDMIGRKVTVSQDAKTLKGTATGIKDDGSLVLRTTTGKNLSIVSGDVHVRY
jgi:BirA family biotin operon repressor/biotin-[acetyl-CoA-carboxylase] ligase